MIIINEGKHLFEYNGFYAEDGQYFIHFAGCFGIVVYVFRDQDDAVRFTGRAYPSYKPDVVFINYIIKGAGIDDAGEAEFFYSNKVTASEPGFHTIAGYGNNAINIANNGCIYT